MAVATGTLRRRQKQEQKQAAKSKRDKIILAVGGAVLLLVLVFELPTVLGSSSSSSPPPPPVDSSATPSISAPVGAPTAAQIRSDLREIAALPQKDPFQAQLADGSVPTTTPTLAKPPHVRNSHFVLKNPFKVQVAAAQASAAPPAPLAKPPHVTAAAKPGHKAAAAKTSSAPLGFIVILRSLDSKSSALQEAKKAHGQGLVSAGVLYSSKYTSLRHGYWVVYLAKYPSMAAANSGLQQARAHGYASAYRRPVKK